MRKKQLFINQIMLAIAGGILIVTGLISARATSATFVTSGIFFVIAGPFSLYLLHKKTSEVIDD